MNMMRRHRTGLCLRKSSLLADQRGAVAFEMPMVFGVLLFTLFLPLADLAIAGFQYLSATQALRAFGQSILYSPPPDFSNTSSWAATAIAKADPKYPIPSIQFICGDANAACSAANTAIPQYYLYSTSVTLSPLVLSSVLCPGGNCKITLSYSERFQ